MNKAVFSYFDLVLDKPILLARLFRLKREFRNQDTGPRIVELENGCWRFLGGGFSRGGYMFFKFCEIKDEKYGDGHYKVAAVMHFLSNTRSHQENPGTEYSHLCHHYYCVNPDHITLELHANNLSRKPCNASKTCVCSNSIKCIFHRSNRARLARSDAARKLSEPTQSKRKKVCL